MAQWGVVIVLAAMFALMLEARYTFGARIVRIERDLAWLIAGLRKWGLAAPGYEVGTGLAPESGHDQRSPKPPTPRR
jgi:hypothetical protein